VSLRDRVYAALDTVRDPELDESVLIAGLRLVLRGVRGRRGSGAVEVHLRLPTYFCAPTSPS